MLRQDPDTIVVGEVRDRETAKLALESALTGHKVFTTFHTENSVSVVIRLLEMGVEPFLVSSTLTAVIAQRLVRRLCPHCAVPRRPRRQELRYLGMERSDLQDAEPKGERGCPKCDQSGFQGRVGIQEVLVPGDAFREAVLGKASAAELGALARQSPYFLSMQEDALLKMSVGLTSIPQIVHSVPRDTHCRSLKEIAMIAGARRKR